MYSTVHSEQFVECSVQCVVSRHGNVLKMFEEEHDLLSPFITMLCLKQPNIHPVIENKKNENKSLSQI